MPDFHSRPSDRRPRQFHDNRRKPDPRFDTKVLQLDMSDNLISQVREIARERNISLYRQIREFCVNGIREYYEDRQIAERDEDTPPQDVFANSQEWNP